MQETFGIFVFIIIKLQYKKQILNKCNIFVINEIIKPYFTHSPGFVNPVCGKAFPDFILGELRMFFDFGIIIKKEAIRSDNGDASLWHGQRLFGKKDFLLLDSMFFCFCMGVVKNIDEVAVNVASHIFNGINGVVDEYSGS